MVRTGVQALLMAIAIIAASHFGLSSDVVTDEEDEADAQCAQSADFDQMLPCQSQKFFNEISWPKINYNAFIIYYSWFGNETIPNEEGNLAYYHWKQRPRSHNVENRSDYYAADGDICSRYFPLLGTYSSRDKNTVDQHFRWIRSTGIGVVAVSFFRKYWANSEEEYKKDMKMMLDVAEKYELKIAFLVEKYNNNVDSFGGSTIFRYTTDVQKHYGTHKALYRMSKGNKKKLPLYFIVFSSLLSSQDWAVGLTSSGSQSVRGQPYDGYFGMTYKSYESPDHAKKAREGGFDSIFTYATPEKKWDNLVNINKKAKANGLSFHPSIQVGYDKSRLYPFSVQEARPHNAEHLQAGLSKIIEAKIPYMMITSFNEWQESSQLEPAEQNKKIEKTRYHPDTNKTDVPFEYKNYPNLNPYYYLDVTRHYVTEHRKMVEKLQGNNDES